MKKANVFTEKDLKALLKSLHGKTHCERNSLIIQLSYYLGLRSKELASLTLSDVQNRDTLTLDKEQTKGQKARQIPLSNAKVKKIIRDYLKFYKANYPMQGNQPLFRSQKGFSFTPNTMQKLIKSIYVNNGFKDGYTSHSGRRSFITALVTKGISIDAVQQLAGHSNISTTMCYVKTDPNKLAEVMKNL